MNFSTATTSRDRTYQVSDIARSIKRFLEERFGEVWIEGELSNLRCPASGHLYFTLKDETAQIRAVFFRGNQWGRRPELRDGMKVRVFGTVTMYEKGGDCQVNVLVLESAGIGALQERFEQLKRKLLEEGLFDASRKKPLPLLPQHIGVVTSPTGAAIRDVLNVITRRFPNLHVLIMPVRVQGEGAAEEIARGIDLLNRRGGLDVILVTRGGGSLEDLWCFNEECVARAITRSAIPIISAVGHEVDFTICDFAADLRAPTPSAAAELVVGRKDELEVRLGRLQKSIRQGMAQQLRRFRDRLQSVRRSYMMRDPLAVIRANGQQVDQLRLRSAQSMQTVLARETRRVQRLTQHACLRNPENLLIQARKRLDDCTRRMELSVRLRIPGARTRLASRRTALHHAASMCLGQWTWKAGQWRIRLEAVNPDQVLQRGYTMTCSEDGKILVSRADALKAGKLMTRWRDGALYSKVLRENNDWKDREVSE